MQALRYGDSAPNPMALFSTVTDTLMRQLVSPRFTGEQAAMVIHRMTRAKTIVADQAITLHFGRQTGRNKITHLVVTYNPGTDLYDLAGHRFNRKTATCPQVWNADGIFAEDLRRICEDATGLYFTL